MTHAALFLAVMAAFCTPAAADPDRLSILLGSAHPGDGGQFDGRNPGLALTWEDRGAWGFDLSIAAYRNSYGRGSVALTAALPLLEWQDGAASLFAGAAWYPEDGRHFAVHIGDVVPLAGVQVRHRNLFVQILPGDGRAAEAVIAAGITFQIGE